MTKKNDEAWGDPQGKPCPYCGQPMYRSEGGNSLSRWLADDYICPKCGGLEAFVDLYRRGAKLCFTGLSDRVSLVVEGRAGHIPLGGDCAQYIGFEQACQIAKDLNGRLKEPVDKQAEMRIVGTTMHAQHVGY